MEGLLSMSLDPFILLLNLNSFKQDKDFRIIKLFQRWGLFVQVKRKRGEEGGGDCSL